MKICVFWGGTGACLLVVLETTGSFRGPIGDGNLSACATKPEVSGVPLETGSFLLVVPEKTRSFRGPIGDGDLPACGS
jgi:hypothetical protein